MKTSLSLTLLVATSGMLSAQPVLNSCAVSFPVGTVISGIQHSADTTGFSPVQLGANVTWNYANLPSTSTGAYSSTFVAVSSTPNPSAFSGATIAQDQGGGAYYYPSFQAGAASYHGFYINANTCNTYSDPVVQYNCPLNYGNSFNDTYVGATCNALTFTGARRGTYAGYGTLILPHATFTNAVLIHTFDTITQFGFSSYYEYHTWYDGSNNIGRLASTRISNSLSPGSTLSVSYLEITSSTSNIEQQTLADAIHVYPNPARTEVQVDVPAQIGRGQFHLLDLHGKTLLQSPIHAGQGEVLLPELAAGIYLYQVRDQRGNLAKAGKLVKE